ncbi:hypothetical protein DM02DRAFT_309304 [Periconia macrospinosa]|uniref:Uncharacterized protein n=1 Tax=Periconia macrospinosa TaxID=97972 RepID=A0A2V1DW33_9PLEO|nr:hypothetical protein DM02DRAFT_309304 [Periconia macrospinosa]
MQSCTPNRFGISGDFGIHQHHGLSQCFSLADVDRHASTTPSDWLLPDVPCIQPVIARASPSSFVTVVASPPVSSTEHVLFGELKRHHDSSTSPWFLWSGALSVSASNRLTQSALHHCIATMNHQSHARNSILAIQAPTLRPRTSPKNQPACRQDKESIMAMRAASHVTGLRYLPGTINLSGH